MYNHYQDLIMFKEIRNLIIMSLSIVVGMILLTLFIEFIYFKLGKPSAFNNKVNDTKKLKTTNTSIDKL